MIVSDSNIQSTFTMKIICILLFLVEKTHFNSWFIKIVNIGVVYRIRWELLSATFFFFLPARLPSKWQYVVLKTPFSLFIRNREWEREREKKAKKNNFFSGERYYIIIIIVSCSYIMLHSARVVEIIVATGEKNNSNNNNSSIFGIIIRSRTHTIVYYIRRVFRITRRGRRGRRLRPGRVVVVVGGGNRWQQTLSNRTSGV